MGLHLHMVLHSCIDYDVNWKIYALISYTSRTMDSSFWPLHKASCRISVSKDYGKLQFGFWALKRSKNSYMTSNSIVQSYNSINSLTSQETVPQFYIQARPFNPNNLWVAQYSKTNTWLLTQETTLRLKWLRETLLQKTSTLFPRGFSRILNFEPTLEFMALIRFIQGRCILFTRI